MLNQKEIITGVGTISINNIREDARDPSELNNFNLDRTALASYHR